ncbi:MAG: energy transducer TonB [Prevotella sp.]|jgi:protein TonB|nr:energy transducer TonB [Prevotella sp.]
MKKFLLFIIFSFVCIYSQAQKNQTIKAKAVKVSEVLNDGSVIAYTMNNDSDCIKVKITRDPNTFYYDDQIIDVPTGSLIIVGTYRHYSSTYPVVKIPKQEIKEVTPTKNSKISKSKKIYDVVDEMPVFPGGNGALLEYLATHVKYPVVAQENGVQGHVIVSFVVECDGSIADVRVERSVDPSLDREAIRVVSSMPRWSPGKLNGYIVRVKYSAPVAFKLQ